MQSLISINSKMIITNKNTIIFKMKKLITFLILTCLLTGCGFMMKTVIKTELRWPLLCLSLVVTIFLLKQIWHLRVIQFENTGAVFSVKSYHPLQKGIIFPVLEFPITAVKAVEREKSILSDNVIVTINSKNNKKNRFKIAVTHISNQEFSKIKNSFK